MIHDCHYCYWFLVKMYIFQSSEFIRDMSDQLPYKLIAIYLGSHIDMDEAEVTNSNESLTRRRGLDIRRMTLNRWIDPSWRWSAMEWQVTKSWFRSTTTFIQRGERSIWNIHSCYFLFRSKDLRPLMCARNCHQKWPFLRDFTRTQRNPVEALKLPPRMPCFEPAE